MQYSCISLFAKLSKLLDVFFHGINHYQHFKADRDCNMQAVIGTLPTGISQDIRKPWVHLLCRYLYKEQFPGQPIQPLRMGDPSYPHHQLCVHQQQFLSIWPCQWPTKGEHTSVVVRIARMQQGSKSQLRSILNSVSCKKQKCIRQQSKLPNLVWWFPCANILLSLSA